MGWWRLWASNHVSYAWKKYYKILVGHNVSTENLLMPSQSYMEHVVPIRGSVGLPRTDDPLKGKDYRFSTYSNYEWTVNEKCFH